MNRSNAGSANNAMIIEIVSLCFLKRFSNPEGPIVFLKMVDIGCESGYEEVMIKNEISDHVYERDGCQPFLNNGILRCMDQKKIER